MVAESMTGSGRPSLPALLPARLRAVRRPVWWQELAFIALSYFLYWLIRAGVPQHRTQALRRARSVFHFETRLHIEFEHALNHAVASVHWLAVGANYYYATMHFVVTIVVLVWLYFAHPLRYRAIRSVLYATTLIALAGFWLYPLAPPRMLTGQGFVDTIIRFHTWGSYGSGSVGKDANQFAAMPSLHIAWSLWAGIAVFMLVRNRLARVLALLYPALTLVVILGTANHFLLDAVGGVAAVSLGFGVQRLLSGRPAFAAPPVDVLPAAARDRVAALADGPAAAHPADTPRPRSPRQLTG